MATSLAFKLAASFEECMNINNFLTDKLPRCGGDEWSGSNRSGRLGCGGLLRLDVVWFGEIPGGCQKNSMV